MVQWLLIYGSKNITHYFKSYAKTSRNYSPRSYNLHSYSIACAVIAWAAQLAHRQVEHRLVRENPAGSYMLRRLRMLRRCGGCDML